MEKKDTSFLESFGEILKTTCHQDEPPFCTVACPFHLDIKEMEPKWESGRWNAVYRSFQTAVGFPVIVSALCPRPCENACILKERGGALAIGEIERAVIRLARRKTPNAYNLPKKPQRAAIIGGGLSGLGCALRLCNKKYQVTIFERGDALGGHARSMMDAEIFDEEIRNQFQYEKPEIRLRTEVICCVPGREPDDAASKERMRRISPDSAVSEADEKRKDTSGSVAERVLFEEIRQSFDVVYVATGAGGEDFGLIPDTGGAFATTTPGVFLGGAMTEADDITALAQGIRASVALERYIKIGLMNEPADVMDTKLKLDPRLIPEIPAVIPEGEDGFSAEEVAAEAKRCRKCSCDICMRECDLMRIQQKTPGRLYEESYITVRPSTLANDGRWATRRIASCDQCGLCRTVCPQRIDMGEFLLQSHRGLKETDAMPWAFHDYWLRDMEFSRTEACLVMPGDDSRVGNACAEEENNHAGVLCEESENRRFVLFPGCQMAASDPRYVMDSFAWLKEKLPGSGLWMNCCGAPAVWAVEDELHTRHLADLREQWEKLGRPKVVFTCPTCRKMFDRYLPEIPGVFLEELMCELGLPDQNAEEKATAAGTSEKPAADMPPGSSEEGAALRTVYAVFDPCASRDYPELQRSVRTLADRLGVSYEDLSHTGDLARCCSFGGQYAIAAPDYAKRVRMERAEESPLPYITYCVNCRDTFAARGKENLHILDLVFGRVDRRRETPTVTGRWENRRRLKRELLERCASERELSGRTAPEKGGCPRNLSANGCSAGDLAGEEPAVTGGDYMTLLVEKELEKKLSEQYILVSDMETVVSWCEEEGCGVLNPSTGHITGHRKIQNMTYWAEYEPLPDGTFRLHNGYAHRMNLEGE